MKTYQFRIALLICLMAIGLVIALSRQSESRSAELKKLSYRLKWIEETASNLLVGDSDIEIYSMQNTDQLMTIFARRPDIISLRLEMSDITGQGVSAISTMPSLEQLSFSGDLITDEMLDIIVNCKLLKKLHLEFTRVSGRGLKSLSKLENLQELTIDVNWDTVDAENAVNEIALLNGLTRLEVGTWATESMVEHLRKANPRCLIVHKRSH